LLNDPIGFDSRRFVVVVGEEEGFLMKDTTKDGKKDGMKNASDDPQYPVDIQYPSHG
jgi:hypothetical protein